MTTAVRGHTLAVRLDALGDVIICGPAIRALAAGSRRVTVLAGPHGAGAARLLPGVEDVITFDCPWILADAAPVDARRITELVEQLRSLAVDRAVIFTSFHQSALPMALVLRLAAVEHVVAVSEDYPGSLLDIRLPPPGDAPEPVRMLQIAAGAGFPLPPTDDGRLAVDESRFSTGPGVPTGPYTVLHPGASAPARTYPTAGWRAVVDELVRRGEHVVLTGTGAESAVTKVLSAGHDPARVTDLGGALELTGLARVLRGADVVVAGNTGPAHLAVAVGTPVVSLFAPVVPAVRWVPYGAAVAVLGDQEAPCRDSRARVCPIPGHPCLGSVTGAEVIDAIDRLCLESARAPAGGLS